MSALASRDYNKAKAEFESVLARGSRSPGGPSRISESLRLLKTNQPMVWPTFHRSLTIRVR